MSKGKKGKTILIGKVSVRTNKQTPKKSKKTSKGKKRFSNLLSGNLVGQPSHLLNYLTAPDIFGPCRIPRPGGAPRTGLAMDRTQYQITGSATTLVQGAIVSTNFTASQTGTVLLAASSSTLLTATTNISPGSQFPAVTQMDDVNIIAASMVVSYLGAPLNAAGELILGNVANDAALLTSATYNGLYFYPGFLKVPIATLVETPLRVFLTKASPVADQFVVPGSSNLDCNKPLILSSGLTAGGVLNVEITRTFEYRSTIASSSVVPYEIASASMSSDLSSYQDGIAQMARLPASVEEGASEYVREAALGMVGANLAPYMAYGASALIGLARNQMHNRFLGGRNQMVI